MIETNPNEMPVRMSTEFKRPDDLAKCQRLVDGLRHFDSSLNEAWLLGVGKMFYDIGCGIDIWDTSDATEQI